MAATAGLDRAFRSERLVFRCLQNDDDEDDDDAFVHEQIHGDPLNHALSDPNLLRPQGRVYQKSFMNSLDKSPLAVMVCSLPSSYWALLTGTLNVFFFLHCVT